MQNIPPVSRLVARTVTLLIVGVITLAASVAALAQNTATITFTKPKWADGSEITVPLSYNLYQGIGPGTPKTKVATITATTGSVTTGLLSGNTYCFQVTAFVTGQEATTESARSNEGCKSFTEMALITITVQ